MDAQTKRTLAATALCMLLLFGWIKLQAIYSPPPQDVETQVASNNPPASTSAPMPNATTSGPAAGENVLTTAPAAPQSGITAVGGESSETLSLGDDRQDDKRAGFTNDYRFAVTLSPKGASVESVRLSDYRAHVAKDRKNPDHAPYDLLSTAENPENNEEYRSFRADHLWLVDDNKDIDLGEVVWKTEKANSPGEEAVFSTVIQEGPLPILRVTKRYSLAKGSHELGIDYTFENLTPKARHVRLAELGPVGFHREDLRYDHVRALATGIDTEGRVKLAEKVTKPELVKLQDYRKDFVPAPESHFLWTAVSNKYFTCIVLPRPMEAKQAKYPTYLEQVSARSRFADPEVETDVSVVHTYAPKDPVPASGRLAFHVDVYCGPKSERVFDEIPEAKAMHYVLTMAPDRSPCTFDFFNDIMLWLLRTIYAVVRNYGIAIIVLVIIVRSILHPISKRGQIHTMRMQKNMARIKPKLEAMQELYKNDKQRLAQESFKLQREEGANPSAMFLGCLPMVLQMPIWVALYTTLNTNVDLRHAPFLGYIRDLSSQDALIHFNSAYHVPLISSLMGGPITSLNVLPIIMAVLMYGQQKLTQKLTKPDKPPEPKLDKHGNPLPDTTAQQQKMMSFMTIFMGFIFYNMPSGLCLYILCSSFLGMLEQWYIRKHIKEQEARGDFDKAVPAGPKAPAKPGWFHRKVEEMQKLAEQQRLAQTSGPGGKPKKKKSRF